jgi:energy-coupling factor transporter transmembrane protein EcfT
MEKTPDPYVEVCKKINKTSYAVFVPTLILWIFVFLRMMVQKEKAKFTPLIIISVLMIVAIIAFIADYQLTVMYESAPEKQTESDRQIRFAMIFTSDTAYNLAHWFFAVSYFALSFRVELTAKGLPEDTYNCRLHAINILVCLFNVVISAFEWASNIKTDYETGATL